MSKARESIYQVFRPTIEVDPQLRVVYKSRQPPEEAVVKGLIPQYLEWEDWTKSFFVPQLALDAPIANAFAQTTKGARKWLWENQFNRVNIVEQSALALEWFYLKGEPTRTRVYLWIAKQFKCPLTSLILDCNPAPNPEAMLQDFLAQMKQGPIQVLDHLVAV
jgi:hypothetical protein